MSTQRIVPAPGKVAVRVLPSPDMTEGGLHIPVSARKPATMGEVIAVCPVYELDGVRMEPLWLVGAVLVFGEYSGTEVALGREKIIILREQDVLCEVSHDNKL